MATLTKYNTRRIISIFVEVRGSNSPNNEWHNKPGDVIIHQQRPKQYRLRRVLGVAGLFSAAYGNVGSSIYYALGIVALVAIGATPVALLLAGLLFILTALSYAEGTAMLPEAGGSASFARHAFNDLVGFCSGWGLMLSYIVTIAISAYTIPPYLGYFDALAPLKDDPIVGTAVSMGVVFFLMVVNVVGVKESTKLNVFSTAVDLITQISLIILGFVLIFEVAVLSTHMFGAGNWPPDWGQLIGGIEGYWPNTTSLLFGIALAALAFTGVETVSQMAEETKSPEVRAPRALMLMTVTVLVIFGGISIVALSAMTPAELSGEWARDPIAGIADKLEQDPLVTDTVAATLEDLYKPLVAILATTILLIATNAGLLGISRLAFSMGTHQQLPSAFSRIHSRFRTPYVAIILFCLVAILILIPGFFSPNFFEDLGALYTFGSLLSFALAHASILVLRVRRPDAKRPFKVKGCIKIRGHELPVTAIIGFIATFGIWIVILASQPYARLAGISWMVMGLLIYYLYRRHLNLGMMRADEEN